MTDTMTQEALISAIRQRTENYYDAHGLCCSEAILFVLNRGLGGGLANDAARGLMAGFCGGMGGGDGVCGALSGAVAGLGLILGPHLSKGDMRKAAKRLHDTFHAALGSTCCRELTLPHAGNKKAQLKNCQAITGLGAEIAGRIILDLRPQLAPQADLNFLAARDNKAQAVLTKLRSFF